MNRSRYGKLSLCTALALLIVLIPTPTPQLIQHSETRVGRVLELVYADLQAKAPGATYDSGIIGTVTWSNISNSKTTDNVYAAASIPRGALTHYLEDFAFGFSIPKGAIVTGITLQVERHASSPNCITDNSIIMDTTSGVDSDNRASANYWDANDTTATYGGTSDTWGRPWTPNDINTNGFASYFSATNACSSMTIASVDAVSVTVNYTAVEFSISNSGGMTVAQGNSSSSTIMVTSVSGSGGSVSLSCTSGLPSGASCSFSPSSGTPPYSSTLTVSTQSSTQTGSYSVTVTGTESDGSSTHSTAFTLTVNPSSQPSKLNLTGLLGTQAEMEADLKILFLIVILAFVIVGFAFARRKKLSIHEK